ncbi:MAG: GGDEF domain-containing phosphodiesterase [Actinomycetota bacterium]|nr:GGDEF domain-containing phosphodiesterase [Actinomycetota bacterium]
MSIGASTDSNFGRATQAVLQHLSEHSDLGTWALCRYDAEGSYTLAVFDPRGEIHVHETLPAPISRSSDHWACAPVRCPDGSPFGELVGFDPRERAASIASIAPTLQVFASLLGALADTEILLADQHRFNEIADGETDPLTGLGTRQGWERRVRVDDHFCLEFGEQASVIVIELTELKHYNELHGHSAGDEELRIAGAAVRAVLTGRHYAARLTGDRFGALLIGVDEEATERLTRSIHEALGRVGVVGTAVATGVGRRRPETGLGGALAAAEAAIDSTRHPLETDTAKSADTAALVDAMEAGEIKAYFQPIVNLHSGEVMAIEALARWQTNEGVRGPDEFLPTLREAGLLRSLFVRMLDDGLSVLSEFRHISPSLQLAVTFEFDKQVETSVLDSIVEGLAKHDIRPGSVMVQISERQASDLPVQLRQELAQVSELGVQLMLDDFGSGFASLETLSALPIHGVKLNRRFTAQVVAGDRASTVVQAMVEVATKGHLTVVAEGIETEMQRGHLVGIGCTLGQGYLFAVPQPAGSLGPMMSAPLANAV